MSGLIGKITSRNKIVNEPLTDGGILLGSGADAITATAVLANSEMIVGDGTTDPAIESGATLRTSIGVGTGDTPQFTGLNLAGTAITSTAAELNLLDGSSVTNATVSKAVVLDSSGNIALPNTKGISFVATADGGVITSSELFDDYEEGTWTPHYETSSVSSTVAYGARWGHYIKCGGIVTAWGYIVTNTTTWLGVYVQMGGLPFGADSDGVITGYITDCNSFGGDFPSTLTTAVSTRVYLLYRDASDTVTLEIRATDMDGGDGKNAMKFCLTYKSVS
jgi:hypothetical protein